jgi:TolB-like protein
MKFLYTLLVATFLSFNLAAQNHPAVKQDVILKLNGEEMKGKITKISDKDVTFIYSGETLEYAIKKSDILKITHSSGRVETINQPALPSEERKKDEVKMTASPVDHHNKIAVLPFTYLMDRQPGAEEIGYKAQEDTYGFLVKHSAGYTILDPRTTNALLIKAGVTKEKMRGFTMKELSDILGVEYIVDGTVTQNKGYQTSSTSGVASTKVKRDDNEKVKRVSSYGSTNSNSVQRYEVSVSLAIYMDTNASIYNQNHKAFFTNTDGGFSSPLEYLLKRCPLYRK